MKSLVDLLTPGINKKIAEKIVKHYKQMKHNYLLEKHGPSEVDGGQFVEAVARAIEDAAFGSYTPIGEKINIDGIFKRITPKKGGIEETLRIDVPRTLRSIYDVRNRRGAAHLGLFDPNRMDSTYVITTCDWVMAELIRIHNSVSPEEAQTIVDAVIERKIPLVEEFEDDLMVLDPDMRINEQILILLYKKQDEYIETDKLHKWIPESFRNDIEDSLEFLSNLRLVHRKAGHKLTRRGVQIVDGSKPIDADIAINDFSKFLNVKNAKNHDQRVLVIGYWLHKKRRRLTITSDDITKLLRQSHIKPPSNPSQHLSRNSGMGFLERINSGKYKMTEDGLNCMYHRFT